MSVMHIVSVGKTTQDFSLCVLGVCVSVNGISSSMHVDECFPVSQYVSPATHTPGREKNERSSGMFELQRTFCMRKHDNPRV